ITDNTCYSSGWALGQLKYFPAAEIHAAYGDGRLTNADILVTDQVPAEIPVVAGVITLTPATPNSHVAILSRSFGIPFAYPSGEALQEQIRALENREVLMVTEMVEGDCVIRIQSVEGKLSPEERQAILDSKRPPAIGITPIARAGSYSLETLDLTPSDIGHVGGKAANFGFLRRSISANAPDPAIALTFDLWSDFMSQAFGAGTLAESIAIDLEGQTFPPDLSQLRPKLESIRERIRTQADFTPAQRAAILGALGPFTDTRKVRFRSSTNVEDSTTFSGAGLYDSFSGCIRDDTDADGVGPSHCDPEKAEERGVFRALRKVYASFYNENAFIERLRHRIDESQVGMAVLVHYSFPDEIELANGVATLEIEAPTEGARAVTAQLVSQTGASSITNPDANHQAEIVSASFLDLAAGSTLTVRQSSGLLEQGETVLSWTSGYSELISLLDIAALSYHAYYPEESRIELDFEWKYVAPGALVIKQIRRVPNLPSSPAPIID
ncbi:MAG: PEP/pyruvate-binding domain-containing protein, partial [Verrucomicrobiales bacterium]